MNICTLITYIIYIYIPVGLVSADSTNCGSNYWKIMFVHEQTFSCHYSLNIKHSNYLQLIYTVLDIVSTVEMI
jgi:hypothetical protein